MFTHVQIKGAGWTECEILGTTGHGSIRVRRCDTDDICIILKLTFNFYKKHEEAELIQEKVIMPSGKEVIYLN